MAIGKTLTIYLAADTAKLNRGMRDAETGLKGFTNKLEGMVGPALIGAAAAAGTFAIAAGVDGVKSAISLGESVNKASVIFGNASAEIMSFAENANSSLGQTQQQAIDAASTFATFGKSAGLSGHDLAAFSTELVTLSADFASFNNSTPEEAIAAVGAALRGEAEPLRRFGVLLDDARLRSRAMEMGIYDGSGALTAQQKVLAAHNEILAQSKDAQGDFARTSDSLANQARILGASFDDLKTSFGKGLLNGMGDVSKQTQGLSKSLQDAQKPAETTGKLMGWLGSAVADMWSQFMENRGINNVQSAIAMLLNIGDAAETSAQQIDTWVNAFQQIDQRSRGGYSGIPSTKGYFSLDEVRVKLNKMDVATTSAKKSTSGLTSTAQEMPPKLRAAIDSVKKLTTQLDDARSKLDAARQAMNSWISDMAGKITAGIDLGAAFSAQFNDLGEKTGLSLLDGFNKQIESAGVFGDYLKQLNTEGGPELRDAVAALGPEVGNKLAKQIIDEGLAKGLQSKLVDVRHMAETTAMTMVPEWATAGVASAVAFVTETQNALAAATSTLEEMGRSMGSVIGEAAAQEIRDALAAAGVAQSGAVSTIAGTAGTVAVTAAEVRAQVAQRIDNPFMNATAIMQAIQQGIADSNQRLGRTGQVVLQ